MTEVGSFSKKLCMTELQAERMCYRNSHYFDAGCGKVNSSFGYITKGSVRISSMGRSIEIGAGSLFYLPERIRYNSVWHGDPDIDFFSLNIVSKRPDAEPVQNFALTVIPEFSTPETGERIAEIFRLFATGDRICKIRAIGLYYGFYADVLPYLRPEPPVKYNPALVSAIEYIEKHCADDFGMDELAAHCCVSTSRLHHLFANELGTTPVKYRNELRIEKAAGELRGGDRTLDDIAGRCGFNSTAYFREIFRSVTGLTPTEYRNLSGAEKE